MRAAGARCAEWDGAGADTMWPACAPGAPFTRQNWRFKLFLAMAAWSTGIYIWGEAFGLRCARGVYDWRLLSLHERTTGEKPLYHPGSVEDKKEKDEEEW